MSRLYSSIVSKLRQRLDLDVRDAYLGNGSGEVHDRRYPGNYYVRFSQANGTYTMPISLPASPNANLPAVEGTPVKISYDDNGQQIILKVNRRAFSASGANPLQLNPLDSQSNNFVTQGQLSTFLSTRHADVDNKPFYAVVFPGMYYDDTGVLQYFPGEAIDLLSLQPGADEHCYAVVFLQADAGTLAAFASTAVNTADPLTMVDIQEATAAAGDNDIPVWAFQIRGDDSALTVDPARSVDLRWPADMPGGGGAGTVTSVGFTAAPTGIFDVTGSPITGSGTVSLSMDNQSANTVLSGPTSGGAATPAFRALVADDVPNLSAAKITSGQLALARGGTNADLSGTGGAGQVLKQSSAGAAITVSALSSSDIPDISATYIPNAIVNAKGDIIAASADNTPAIRSVGADGTVLVADSGQASGLNWASRALPAQVSVYTADDTWVKPAGVTLVEVILIGGGGGGGSGRKGNSNTHRRGGSGGGGGHMAHHIFIPSFLDASMTVDIGAGGGGGAAQTTASTNGNDGTDGSPTRFLGASSGTIFLVAGGGKKGLGGGNDGTNAVAGGQGGTAWGGTNQTAGDGQYGGGEIGGNGGDGLTAGGAAERGGGGGGGTLPNATNKDGGGSVYGAAGGAAGGGSAAANNTASAAGAGGTFQNYGTGGGGTAGTSGGANAGGAGGSPTYTRWGGAGGGGGGAGVNGSADTTGGTGGAGGNYGGGGGGGGAGTGTGNSGAGGAGAGGIVIVIAYF